MSEPLLTDPVAGAEIVPVGIPPEMVAVAVMLGFGVVASTGFAVCCVHPAIKIAEMTTNERIRSVLFFIVVSPQWALRIIRTRY
jgi:hypothetical protein